MPLDLSGVGEVDKLTLCFDAHRISASSRTTLHSNKTLRQSPATWEARRQTVDPHGRPQGDDVLGSQPRWPHEQDCGDNRRRGHEDRRRDVPRPKLLLEGMIQQLPHVHDLVGDKGFDGDV